MLVLWVLRECLRLYRWYYGNGNVGIVGIKVMLMLVLWVSISCHLLQRMKNIFITMITMFPVL